MDVLQRLIPGHGVQFQRLKHSSQSSAPPSAAADDSPNSNIVPNPNTKSWAAAEAGDRDNLRLIPATNSSLVGLGLVLNGKDNQLKKKNKKKKEGNNNRGDESIPAAVESNNGALKTGGRRLIAALLPRRKKGHLITSASEPRLDFAENGAHYQQNGFGSLNSSVDGEIGGQDREQCHQNGETHRLYCEGTTIGGRSTAERQSHVTGALQRVRSKFRSRLPIASNNGLSAPASSSASFMHRSNTVPTHFSSATNIPNGFDAENVEERGEKNQQQQNGNGPVLTKLRKQAKIMDIMMRKSHGNSDTNRKSDAQRLLLSEEGYGSGMD